MLTRRVERRANRPPLQPIYDDFQPPKEWIEEPSNYILRLYLSPVFKKEDLNIIYDQSGKITVRGRKQVGESKFARFESSYNVPKDSNLEKISGKFENNILSLTIPKIVIVKPSEEKKEEPILKEEPKKVTEERKEEEIPKEIKEKPLVSNEKLMIPGEEGKEEPMKTEIATEDKIKEAADMNEAMQHIDEKMKEESIQEKPKTMEEKKEESSLKEKSKIVTEEKKEEEALKEIKEKPVIPKEKAMMAEEERKESSMLNDMKEEPKKIEMATGEKIKEAASLKELKEEPIEKEPNTMEEKKEETIQKNKMVSFDREKKEDSTKKEEAITMKLRYCQETEVHKKETKEKESKKRRWLWNEEDKGWLDWLDSAFIDDVLKKVYRNKKVITLALVAFSTGFYISRKLRTRG